MSEDPFAFQVQRLTDRHRARHAPATVAEVTLQRWLVLRNRYDDPFDPELFDSIDAGLGRLPPTAGATTRTNDRARSGSGNNPYLAPAAHTGRHPAPARTVTPAPPARRSA